MIVLRFAWTYPGEFLPITLGAEPCYFRNSNSNAYFGEIGEQFSSEFRNACVNAYINAYGHGVRKWRCANSAQCNVELYLSASTLLTPNERGSPKARISDRSLPSSHRVNLFRSAPQFRFSSRLVPLQSVCVVVAHTATANFPDLALVW